MIYVEAVAEAREWAKFLAGGRDTTRHRTPNAQSQADAHMALLLADRIEALEAALAPLVRVAKDVDDGVPDGLRYDDDMLVGAFCEKITIGDCRLARNLISPVTT